MRLPVTVHDLEMLPERCKKSDREENGLPINQCTVKFEIGFKIVRKSAISACARTVRTNCLAQWEAPGCAHGPSSRDGEAPAQPDLGQARQKAVAVKIIDPDS